MLMLSASLPVARQDTRTTRGISLATVSAYDARERARLAAWWVRGATDLQRTSSNAAKIFKVSRTLVVAAKNGAKRAPCSDPPAKAWDRASAQARTTFLQANVDAVRRVLDGATAPAVVNGCHHQIGEDAR